MVISASSKISSVVSRLNYKVEQRITVHVINVCILTQQQGHYSLTLQWLLNPPSNS